MLFHINPTIICVALIPKTLADVVVSTLAGSGSGGFADGVGTDALFYAPAALAFEKSGVLYVADRYNNRIRKVTLSGVVTTYAGGGTTTVTDSNGNPASFNQPNGVAFDTSGNLFIVDLANNQISKITSANVFSVFVGNGTSGSANGVGTNATFNTPSGVAVDSSGNLYIVEFYGNKVRKVTSSSAVTTLAGSSAGGAADGVGTAATFSHPTSDAVDDDDDDDDDDDVYSVIIETQLVYHTCTESKVAHVLWQRR